VHFDGVSEGVFAVLGETVGKICGNVSISQNTSKKNIAQNTR